MDQHRPILNLTLSFSYFSLVAEVYLHDCLLEGSLPETFGSMTSLGKFLFDGRDWQSEICFKYPFLSLLTLFPFLAVILDVSNNTLVGEVPDSFANLVNLQSLDVSGNAISGAIPVGICGLDGLDTLIADCEVVCSCCSACV